MGGTMFTLHCGSVCTLRMPESKTWIRFDSSMLPNSLLEQGPPQFKGMRPNRAPNSVTAVSGLQ